MRAGRLLILGVLALAACAPVAPQRITETRNDNAKYLCDGTLAMTVRFTPFKAALDSEGVATELAQQPAGDGLLYTGSGQSLRTRGHDAAWTDEKGVAHACRERF